VLRMVQDRIRFVARPRLAAWVYGDGADHLTGQGAIARRRAIPLISGKRLPDVPI